MDVPHPHLAGRRRAGGRGQFAGRLAAPRRRGRARNHHRRRHVVDAGRAAGGAGRLRGRARRCLAAVHADDARLRIRRCSHGAAVRSLRHRDADRCAGRSRSALGYVIAALAPNLLLFALAHILIGLGASAAFGPLMADMSRWFTRRRGIAVAIVSQRELSRPARSGHPCCSTAIAARAGADPHRGRRVLRAHRFCRFSA